MTKSDFLRDTQGWKVSPRCTVRNSSHLSFRVTPVGNQTFLMNKNAAIRKNVHWELILRPC